MTLITTPPPGRCPDCNAVAKPHSSAVVQNAALHETDCPLFHQLEAVKTEDEAWFPRHPFEDHFYRQITDAERSEMRWVHPDAAADVEDIAGVLVALTGLHRMRAFISRDNWDKGPGRYAGTAERIPGSRVPARRTSSGESSRPAAGNRAARRAAIKINHLKGKRGAP